MNRSFLVVTLVGALGACRHPAGPADATVPPPVPSMTAAPPPPPHLVAATTTMPPPPLPASADAPTRVQAILPHWIEVLERDDDETFIDEAVVPGELAKVLGGKSKAELVATFREDKHKGVLKMLRATRGASPTKIREEGEQTLVTYDLRGEKGVTFVVVGSKVYVKN